MVFITEQDRVSSNYQKTGDIITLLIQKQLLLFGTFASKFINVSAFNVFTWIGSIDQLQVMNGKKQKEHLIY